MQRRIHPLDMYVLLSNSPNPVDVIKRTAEIDTFEIVGSGEILIPDCTQPIVSEEAKKLYGTLQ